MNMNAGDDIDSVIQNGIVFERGARQDSGKAKVKTKAKKKSYITGAHGSGSAMQKAKYREMRNRRHKNK